jgi:DNA-binding transcriptional regulator YiaG
MADGVGSQPVGEERNARRANAMDIHVGARVRIRRVLVGMSQEKLGELLGLTFQQVQKYEKGINRIGAGRLRRVQQRQGLPIKHQRRMSPISWGPRKALN